MAEEETKKDTSKTVKKEEKIAKNSIKDIIYNNYKKEKTIKIFSIIIVVELFITALQIINSSKSYITFIPYVIAFISIGIFLVGIFKNNLSFIKQFKYSFGVFLFYYSFSLMIAVFSILAVMIMLYIFSGNSPSDENVPSVSSFFTGTFKVYGVIQPIIYFSYYICGISYIKDKTVTKNQ